jgi:hypothetical protein
MFTLTPKQKEVQHKRAWGTPLFVLLGAQADRLDAVANKIQEQLVLDQFI